MSVRLATDEQRSRRPKDRPFPLVLTSMLSRFIFIISLVYAAADIYEMVSRKPHLFSLSVCHR